MALGNPKAYGQVYNISGPKYVTFDGIAKACAEAMGKKAELVHFNPKDFDFGKKKGFPLRDQVCYADGWTCVQTVSDRVLGFLRVFVCFFGGFCFGFFGICC